MRFHGIQKTICDSMYLCLFEGKDKAYEDGRWPPATLYFTSFSLMPSSPHAKRAHRVFAESGEMQGRILDSLIYT